MNRLPSEIQNYIYEIAIKTYFKENIEPRIWYRSWEIWRRTILNDRANVGVRKKIDFAIDYFFNSRGIYETCEQKLFGISLPSFWNPPRAAASAAATTRPAAEKYTLHVHSSNDTLYVYFVEYDEDAATAAAAEENVFRTAVFTHAEYVDFFCGSSDERAYVDVAENEHYKMCYILSR